MTLLQWDALQYWNEKKYRIKFVTGMDGEAYYYIRSPDLKNYGHITFRLNPREQHFELRPSNRIGVVGGGWLLLHEPEMLLIVRDFLGEGV